MIIELTIKTWSGIAKGKYSISVNDSEAEEIFKKLIKEMQELKNESAGEELEGRGR